MILNMVHVVETFAEVKKKISDVYKYQSDDYANKRFNHGLFNHKFYILKNLY